MGSMIHLRTAGHPTQQDILGKSPFQSFLIDSLAGHLGKGTFTEYILTYCHGFGITQKYTWDQNQGKQYIDWSN